MSILGHSNQIEYLNKILQRGRLAHAYLFYGPSNIGKFTLARQLAKTFYCQNYRGLASIEKVCNDCKQCIAIEQGNHPQVFILDTENTLVSKKDKRKDIPIDDIRELKRLFSFAPVGDEMRVAIINEADKMSREAADAFLKILEEPGIQTIIILIAPTRESLSPTIVSRNQPIGFSLLPDKILKEFMESKKVSRDLQEEILWMAEGRPGIMLNFLQDGKYLERERKFKNEIIAVIERGKIADALYLSGKISADSFSRDTAGRYLLRFLKSKMASGSSDTPAVIAKIKNIIRIMELLDTTNVNQRLGIDAMFLEAISV